MATRGVDKLALEETEELSEDEFDFEKEKDRFVQNETDNTDATELRSLIWKTFTAYAGAFLEEAWKVAEGQKEENVDESLANESTVNCIAITIKCDLIFLACHAAKFEKGAQN